MTTTPGRQFVEYWIGDYEDDAVVLSYRNLDNERGNAADSVRRGPFKVLRCRLWALRNGCGWPERRRNEQQ